MYEVQRGSTGANLSTPTPTPAQVSDQHPTFQSQVERAIGHLEREFAVTPVKRGTKKPILHNWPTQKVERADIPALFGQMPVNIGVVLGEASGGLIDIDLDCPEATRAAAVLMPHTECVFGRVSKPQSHYLYRVGVPGKTRQFRDPTTGNMLIEWRSNGAQTIFPGSVHPSGEAVRFDHDGEPTITDADGLMVSVKRTAAAALLAKRWRKDSRHSLALALAGALIRGGWHAAEADQFVEAICDAAGDEELDDRLRCVQNTAAKLERGDQVTGLPTLASLLGEPIAKKVSEWLGLTADSVAPASVELGSTQGEVMVPHDLPLSDASNANVFAHRYRNEARYCHTRKRWFLWNGKWWVEDETGQVTQLAIRCVKELGASLLASAKGEEAQKKVRSFITRSLNAPGINGMLKLSQPLCAADANSFDTDPMLLNCDNGTLDLRTGELHKHQPEDLITKIILVVYDPNATCPNFQKFLREILDGDETMVGYVQRAIGYSLTGSTKEQCLFILHGSGANGKSTLLNTTQLLLGPYAKQMQAESIMAKKQQGIPNDIARLAGARMVVSTESDSGQRFNEGLVKQLTGGDTMLARYLYGEYFEFQPQFKLILGTNKRPSVAGMDDGIWRRIHLVPFAVTFPPDKQDKGLPAKLKAELPGILAWAVRGCREWQERGLEPPKTVSDAVQSYRSDMDTVARFLQEACVKETGTTVPVADLFKAYQEWCAANGEQALTKNTFGRALRDRGHEQIRGSAERLWKGLRLKRLEDDLLA